MPRKSSRLQGKQQALPSHSNPTSTTRPAPSQAATRPASSPTRGTRASTRSTTRSSARIQDKPHRPTKPSAPSPKEIALATRRAAILRQTLAGTEPEPNKSDDSVSSKSDDSDSEPQKQKVADVEAELNKPDDSDSRESDKFDSEATHQDEKSATEEADPDPGLIEINQAVPEDFDVEHPMTTVPRGDGKFPPILTATSDLTEDNRSGYSNAEDMEPTPQHLVRSLKAAAVKEKKGG